MGRATSHGKSLRASRNEDHLPKIPDVAARRTGIKSVARAQVEREPQTPSSARFGSLADMKSPSVELMLRKSAMAAEKVVGLGQTY